MGATRQALYGIILVLFLSATVAAAESASSLSGLPFRAFGKLDWNSVAPLKDYFSSVSLEPPETNADEQNDVSRQEHFVDDAEELRLVIESLLSQGISSYIIYIDGEGRIHILVLRSSTVGQSESQAEEIRVALISGTPERENTTIILPSPDGMICLNGGGDSQDQQTGDSSNADEQETEEKTESDTEENNGYIQNTVDNFQETCEIYHLNPHKANHKELWVKLCHGDQRTKRMERSELLVVLLDVVQTYGTKELHEKCQENLDDIEDDLKSFSLLYLLVGQYGRSLSMENMFDIDQDLTKWLVEKFDSTGPIDEQLLRLLLHGTQLYSDHCEGKTHRGCLKRLRQALQKAEEKFRARRKRKKNYSDKDIDDLDYRPAKRR